MSSQSPNSTAAREANLQVNINIAQLSDAELNYVMI